MATKSDRDLVEAFEERKKKLLAEYRQEMLAKRVQVASKIGHLKRELMAIASAAAEFRRSMAATMERVQKEVSMRLLIQQQKNQALIKRNRDLATEVLRSRDQHSAQAVAMQKNFDGHNRQLQGELAMVKRTTGDQRKMDEAKIARLDRQLDDAMARVARLEQTLVTKNRLLDARDRTIDELRTVLKKNRLLPKPVKKPLLVEVELEEEQPQVETPQVASTTKPSGVTPAAKSRSVTPKTRSSGVSPPSKPSDVTPIAKPSVFTPPTNSGTTTKPSGAKGFRTALAAAIKRNKEQVQPPTVVQPPKTRSGGRKRKKIPQFNNYLAYINDEELEEVV